MSWRSHVQSVVALSTMEAEYIAACSAAQTAIHLKRLLCDIGRPQGRVYIYEDNMGALHFAANHVNSSRAKHVDVRFHFLREQVMRGEIILEYIHTDEQIADVLTKALTSDKHKRFSKALMGMD